MPNSIEPAKKSTSTRSTSSYITHLYQNYFSQQLHKLKKLKNAIATCGMVSLMMIGNTAVQAQTTGILSPNDAAVTGFSGVINQTNSISIDNSGPAVRIIHLPPLNPPGLIDVPKRFTVTARDVGQVFGIALDDQAQPDIFVAATSAYGIAIYRPDVGRIKLGAPGAAFMPGQFGPMQLGGGPNSIWRIDGKTGNVTLFANLSTNDSHHSPAALGGLAFDSNTQQLFVADLGTGFIHRLTLDGVDRGIFDHGTTGITSIGQPAIPFDATTLADINSPGFNTEDPNTWGFTAKSRRVYALSVHQHRLYYSAANSEIWSVGISADGSFVNDVRIEVTVPALQSNTQISAIDFDGRGYLYVAERAAPTGDYNFLNVAANGQNRVKRFIPKIPTPSSPTYWNTTGDEYATGMLPNFQNADGGVALTCGRSMWATGDHLLDQNNAASTNFPRIDGLQGTDTNLVEPANMPPQQSAYVNYYDYQTDPNSSGHMGAIAIWKKCGGGYVPPVQIGFTCPPDTFLVNGVCMLPPSCPLGTVFRNGYCIFVECPIGFVRMNNTCVQPPQLCDFGTVFIGNQCVPFTCPPWLELTRNGYCHCPHEFIYQNGQCVPPPCPPYQQYRDGRCMPPCPFNQEYREGRCLPQLPCPPYQQYRDGRCIPQPPCSPYQLDRDGRCLPQPPCPYGQQSLNGSCMPIHITPITPHCSRGQILFNGHCITTTHITPSIHITPHCGRGQIFVNGHCSISSISSTPTHITPRSHTPSSPVCHSGEGLHNGACTRTPMRTEPAHINNINKCPNGHCNTNSYRTNVPVQNKNVNYLFHPPKNNNQPQKSHQNGHNPYYGI